MKAIAFAIPVLIAISLLPIAGVGAQCSEYDYESEPIVGDYYPCGHTCRRQLQFRGVDV